MSEQRIGLEDLKSAVAQSEAASPVTHATTKKSTPDEPRKPMIDTFGRAYATGKRKNATARVWIKAGSGKMIINGRDYTRYFARPVLQMILHQPFKLTNRENQFDAIVTVAGGGLSGQAGAVRHGLSKALTHYDPSLRPTLKHEGLITRDSRVVERKKYGRRKARRRFQFSKR